MRTAVAIVALLALAATPALAQEAPALPEDDCDFLAQSFDQVYAGMRDRGVTMEEADPALVSMFVDIQRNVIMLYTARGCDVSRLVDLARREAARYAEDAPQE